MGSGEARLVFGAEEKSHPLGGPHDVLFRIVILLRAHAIAGITALSDAGEQSQLEEDSTKLRVCPIRRGVPVPLPHRALSQGGSS